MSAISSNTVPPSGIPGKKLFRKKSVHRSAAGYACNNNNYTSSVTCMLKSLNWHTLEYRRNNSSLMYFYTIRNDLAHVDRHHFIPTRNLNYLIPHSDTQYHSNSYFPRTNVSGIRFHAQYRLAHAYQSLRQGWLLCLLSIHTSF